MSQLSFFCVNCCTQGRKPRLSVRAQEFAEKSALFVSWTELSHCRNCSGVLSAQSTLWLVGCVDWEDRDSVHLLNEYLYLGHMPTDHFRIPDGIVEIAMSYPALYDQPPYPTDSKGMTFWDKRKYRKEHFTVRPEILFYPDGGPKSKGPRKTKR